MVVLTRKNTLDKEFKEELEKALIYCQKTGAKDVRLEKIEFADGTEITGGFPPKLEKTKKKITRIVFNCEYPEDKEYSVS